MSKDIPVTDEEYQNLLKKIQVTTTFLYDIGLGCLSSNIYKKICFKHYRHMSPSYIQVHANPYLCIGFGKYYCGVSTYVPNEISRSWISDHHILFTSIRIGHWEMKLIPSHGKLYEIEFHRSGIDSGMNSDDIMNCCVPSIVNPGIKNWIDNIFYNDSERLLYENGISFPCLTEMKINKVKAITQFIKMEYDMRHMRQAYNHISNGLKMFFIYRLFS